MWLNLLFKHCFLNSVKGCYYWKLITGSAFLPMCHCTQTMVGDGSKVLTCHNFHTTKSNNSFLYVVTEARCQSKNYGKWIPIYKLFLRKPAGTCSVQLFKSNATWTLSFFCRHLFLPNSLVSCCPFGASHLCHDSIGVQTTQSIL